MAMTLVMLRHSTTVGMAVAGVTEAATVEGEVVMVEAEDVEGAEGEVAMVQGGEGSSNKTEGNLQLKWEGVLLSEALANGMYNFMIEAVAHLLEIIIARRV